MSDPKPLILIIDDETDWSDILTLFFKNLGYQIKALPGIALAKTWLASNRPALILLDIMMPDGNGLDMCRWIRSQQDLGLIPIIIDSGIKDEETAELALALGAVDFVRKPVNLESLRQKVERLLASKA
jgi:DNA-binding response OmpR family regulator